jgi:uncharacterized metal-binding protein
VSLGEREKESEILKKKERLREKERLRKKLLRKRGSVCWCIKNKIEAQLIKHVMVLHFSLLLLFMLLLFSIGSGLD